MPLWLLRTCLLVTTPLPHTITSCLGLCRHWGGGGVYIGGGGGGHTRAQGPQPRQGDLQLPTAVEQCIMYVLWQADNHHTLLPL
jgi:hypothetical protein